MTIEQYIDHLMDIRKEYGNLEMLSTSAIADNGRKPAAIPEARYMRIGKGRNDKDNKGVWSPRLHREEEKGELAVWVY